MHDLRHQIVIFFPRSRCTGALFVPDGDGDDEDEEFSFLPVSGVEAIPTAYFCLGRTRGGSPLNLKGKHGRYLHEALIIPIT